MSTPPRKLHDPHAHESHERPKPAGAEPVAHQYVAGEEIATKYRLVDRIGEGGMGAVWLARNQVLDVDVCIKLIRHEITAPNAAARLLQEARAAARLSNPSIVRVFDFGQTEFGDPFIVMELLKGESLRDVIERKVRLPGPNAVATILPLAGALVEAHGKGIVHRDLKPENIVLVTDDSGAVIPKIVDFGIAKFSSDDVARRFTAVGTILGSPDYMSPEQAQGLADSDERTDVWALAVVLYELLVGEVPFVGDNYNALLWAINHEPAASIVTRGAGDAELWMILERGLEKKPGDRWQTMKAFGIVLAEWAVARGVETDVTGASIELNWLTQSTRRPLSEAPPSELRVSSTGASVSRGTLSSDSEVTLPRAAVPAARMAKSSASQLPTMEAVAPVPAAPMAAPPRASRALWVAGMALLLGAGAVVAFRSGVGLGRDPGPVGSVAPAASSRPSEVGSPAPSASPRVVSPVPVEPAPTPPTGSAPAAAVDATAGVTAKAARAAAADVNACVLPLFPAGTFASSGAPDFRFLCSERDPRIGGPAMRMQVVRARGTGVSEAMREWSQLGWYELAAFAVARATCCGSDLAPFKLPPTGGVCASLDAPLTDLGEAAASGANAIAALERFTDAVNCILRRGEPKHYPFTIMRLEGQDASMRKILERVGGLRRPAP